MRLLDLGGGRQLLCALRLEEGGLTIEECYYLRLRFLDYERDYYRNKLRSKSIILAEYVYFKERLIEKQ